MESRTTLLSNDLKRHLFNLFASWSGPTAKPLGFSHAGYVGSAASGALSGTAGASNASSIGTGTSTSGTNISLGSIPAEEEKLQFSALQVSYNYCECVHALFRIYAHSVVRYYLLLSLWAYNLHPHRIIPNQIVFYHYFVFKAMSALLCCGPCFDGQYLAEEGLIYHWLDSLLITSDDKVSTE